MGVGPSNINRAMHIILTHEQADFDALASLLGAHLLNERAVPVLPRRMNRNVRAFLTLYGMVLPFIEPRDLPGEPIDKVTLVDTQSMISIKGMIPDIEVHVIDHHPLRNDLPPDWDITVSGTGANTTIFVESIRERDLIISPILATLLLLGVYEDTGSLTYSRTTSRDLNAASYLLDQGANLKIAADFLNHPLSPVQQSIYDRLINDIEHQHIHGQTIIIACGDARDVDEELSTIAHKIRDILDPDALFMLIKTSGGVQLIARSTSDNINVAEIAGHFGGGGHERAAASIVKNRELEDIKEELVDLLPSYVQPSVTVAEIMSRGPNILSPELPVEDAAEWMQRYGYEGYPVVKDGKIFGLLTRRAVDRAISHKLNVPISSLMEAGEVFVTPQASIESLQDIMTETGWGQIPVVNSDTGKIVGIVTRTDLLKTLTPRPRIPSQQSLAEKLDLALPQERLTLLKAVAHIAFLQHYALYIVGGFVRDLLMGVPSLDFDLVVEGDAIGLARALSEQIGGRVTSHARFGTAKWFISPDWFENLKHSFPDFLEKDVDAIQSAHLPETLDFVTARTEFYTHPTALPTVERGSIKLDLHRRDFTINTLALRLDGRHYGELHDYWGGFADLRNGIVRVLHSISFVDDPTRILRAVRFEQRFDFVIEQRTLELLSEALALLGRVSGDRIRHELDHILQENQVVKILSRMDDLNILSTIHQKLGWDEWLKIHFEKIQVFERDTDWANYLCNEEYDEVEGKYILWLIRLSPKEALSVIKRLKLSSKLRKNILASCQLWLDIEELLYVAPSEIVERLDQAPPMAVYGMYMSCDNGACQRIIREYVITWRKVIPTITGHDLRKKGLTPGPKYRQILGQVRNAWLDGHITSREQEEVLVDSLLEKYNNQD